MPTTHLNASNVAKLAPRDATYITYDSVVRGFGVRLTPAGARSYILTYRRQDGHPRSGLSEIQGRSPRNRHFL